MLDAVTRAQTGALSRDQEQRALNGHQRERLEAVRAEVAVLRQEAADSLARTEQAEQAAAARKAEIESLAASKAQALDTLERDRSAFEQQIATDRAGSEQIAGELRAREAAAVATRTSSGKAPAPVTASGGVLGSPLAGGITVTSPFNPKRLHPVYKVVRPHQGTDMRAACGTPVYAAADGEVVRAGTASGYGNLLVIDQGSVAGRAVATAYAHLKSFAVSPGASVRRGQLVAYSGSTGVGTACHLHFEVRVSGTPVNAMDWL